MYELQIQVWVVTFVLILGRVGAFVATLPLFSGRNLPNTVKIGLSLTLSAMWFAAYGIDPPETVWRLAQHPHWLALAQATAREILFGGILGITFGLLLMPARIAGAYIAQEMGLTMATLSDPGQQQSSNIVAQLFDSIGVLLLFALDIHHLILHSVHLAFQRWPCGSPLGSIPPEALAMAMAESHEWGLLIAAPVAIFLFLTLVIVALLMRAAPTMNLFSVGLPLRLGAGLIGLLIFLPDMCLAIQRFYGRIHALTNHILHLQ